MATHYTKERSKYGTLTGTVVAYPVELASGSNPNNFDVVDKLPAGYLRCDGSKYNARDYPLLAEICGTGTNCKFLKFDINDEIIGSISDEEFVVPDLGSKIPRPVSGGDAGVFNNILTTTQNGTSVTRSGIGIEATAVEPVVQITYSGKFILPAQTFACKGKPSWSWGNNSRTDAESVDAAQIYPHMHFSSTSRVRVKSKSGATGGVLTLPPITIDVTDGSLNPQYSGTAFVSYGPGSGELNGFISPGFGSGYVAFGTSGNSPFSSLQVQREYTITLTNPGYSLLSVTAIMGNDSNGGERVNNGGEGIYIVWPDGTKSTSPILPARKESGLSTSQYDAQYDSWRTQSLPIPQAYRNGTFNFKFVQTVVQAGGGLESNPGAYDPTLDADGNVGNIGEQQPSELPNNTTGAPNAFDMCGIVQVGFDGGFENDPSLTDTGNDVPIGINFFKTASTIDIDAWLDATKSTAPANNSPGSGQPACWAIASGTLAGEEVQDVNTFLTFAEYISRYNQCESGCSITNLRCYCLLKDSVDYELDKDWFGIEGTRINEGQTFFSLGSSFSGCPGGGNNEKNRSPRDEDGGVPPTYNYPASNLPNDWKGLPLDDVLPINGQVLASRSFPQARNVYTQVNENEVEGDPTIHSHKIEVERYDHQYSIVTDATLIDPDNLNTTLALTPSSAASIDVATAPFIIVEYLIKT